MKTKYLKSIALLSLGLLTLSATGLGIWIFTLNEEMKLRLEQGWFLPPIEIYSAPNRLKVGKVLDFDAFQTYADSQQMRERSGNQKVLDGDWAVISRGECLSYFKKEPSSEFASCFLVDLPDDAKTRYPAIIALLSGSNEISGLYSLADGLPVAEIKLKPYKFAQYYDGKPILRRLIRVSETPLQCLQAITAIEDSKFLEHKGVSITGTLRAVYKNVVAGRYAEGGSTITQQLVKNYFLTARKTLRRKIKEQFMALLLELHSDKDTILENYLNVIYMGASGPFQVRGFGAASEHYFNKPIEKLNLSECALLAAIVNSPGHYNPFRKPENALKRRKKVLGKMLDQQMIEESELQVANAAPLPKTKTSVLSEPAPYYVQAILRFVKEKEIDASKGLRIFSALDLVTQESAQTTLAKKTTGIENWFRHLKEIREKKKSLLQSSLISIDVETGHVVALVGGRSYRSTQYNRILDAKRQVGSTMKPFVYLAALESYTEDGESYHPLTPIEDSKFTHKYEGQSWSPKNYGDQYFGQVPMYFALKNSLNTATAKIGLSVGLEAVVGLAKRFEISADLKPLPSITLGAFEITPWELARAYTAIARSGNYIDLTIVERIESSDGSLLFQHKPERKQVASAEDTAVLMHMMKQTLHTGTAKASRQMGIDFTAAGKTGTTSDSRDAWFVGFTPELLTVVWVGYDDNTSHGLTGASGALPIWADYMIKAVGKSELGDFPQPEGTYKESVRRDQLSKIFAEYKSFKAPVDLIFRSRDNPFEGND